MGSSDGVLIPGLLSAPLLFWPWPAEPIGAPPPPATGAGPGPPAPAAAAGATDAGEKDGSGTLPTRPAISGGRPADPPTPGNDAARTSPAPEPAPEPPASGWFDTGLAPISPIWAPSLDPKLLPIWLKICVTCCSG